MAAADKQLDVLVLGEHPATYLAAAILRHTGKISVLHATIPGELPVPRLVLINPAFFKLHELLGPLQRKLSLQGLYGARFLADQPPTRSEFTSRTIVSYVAEYRDLRQAMIQLAKKEGVELATPRQLQIRSLDERGLSITLGKTLIHPRVLLLGGSLPASQQALLGLPDEWDPGVMHRYSLVRFKGRQAPDRGSRPVLPMSLDLHSKLNWAWLLPHDTQVQLAVEQPLIERDIVPPAQLLQDWADVLAKHEVLPAARTVQARSVISMDLPLAGALAHEGVANRTLLIGPAGGFYSASGEDIYPNCWSAVFAADVVRKALKERHLQDALQPFRHKWRTTLGEYLRGPQQNLRFLLPLVYRNQMMTDRLAESILLGKSVVR
jgi:flavin-dependent dehydrogenase